MLKPISVLATYTDDIVIEESGNVLTAQPGGSGLFIKNALSDENVDFQDFEKGKLTVEILIAQNQELGKVIGRPTPVKASSIPLTDWVIVSTVLDEWDISTLEKFPKRLIIDVQGYVRDGTEFGKKRDWQPIKKIHKNIFCLKGTREEILCLPEEIVEDQKNNRMLVITNGPDPVDIFYRGRQYNIPTNPITGLENTIGAGDTFLGYFVANLYKGQSIEVAGKRAVNKTGLFLLDKTK